MNARSDLAIYYSQPAYTEILSKRREGADVNGALLEKHAGRPSGLMGREVASQGLLSAFLKHGNWRDLTTVLESERDRESLVNKCEAWLADSATQRRVQLRSARRMSTWTPGDHASVLHFPSPPGLRSETTKSFQDRSNREEVCLTSLGATFRFVRPLNPHSGCFTLRRDQLKRLAKLGALGVPSAEHSSERRRHTWTAGERWRFPR